MEIKDASKRFPRTAIDTVSDGILEGFNSRIHTAEAEAQRYRTSENFWVSFPLLLANWISVRRRTRLKRE